PPAAADAVPLVAAQDGVRAPAHAPPPARRGGGPHRRPRGGAAGRLVAGPGLSAAGRRLDAQPAAGQGGARPPGAPGRRPAGGGRPGDPADAELRGAFVRRAGLPAEPRPRGRPEAPRPGPAALAQAAGGGGHDGVATMSQAGTRESLSHESLVAQVVDEFMERLNQGGQPQPEEYAGRYPELASVLRHVLPALQLLQAPAADAGADTPPDSPPQLTGRLGDCRVVREVGRGGMGIVYEAEQVSLVRRVPLKVLPFATTLDPKQLQRFKNEAQAAAQLHHKHIVPVYA